MKTVAELMHATSPSAARAAGAVRRMAIRLTARALWQLAGYVIDGETEVVSVEPFTGIGHAARPPASSKPEAIVLMVGDAKHPVVVAVRDEQTRAAIAGALKADESMLFNSKALVHVKDDATIEARKPAGTALSLAPQAELSRFLIALTAAIATLGGAIAAPELSALKTAIEALVPAWPAGTTVLKGE